MGQSPVGSSMQPEPARRVAFKCAQAAGSVGQLKQLGVAQRHCISSLLTFVWRQGHKADRAQPMLA
eukprot:CAMPEP_0195064160 /NCGR_PEP_ID=MMETSP0448-20130528/10335_1 /TAXON_ID=66468 /ORGANISM="Heterocapsa triquestra, Strain CCMP 448" /LENGTH=65 /DNA_ID=CAMNT_0040095157 /DNA_START=76 /DNA_END=268 /DNA_ORIENTATION=-